MRGFKVPQSIIKSNLKHAALKVYLYLIYRQKNGTADFTYNQLAEALELSNKTVFNSVKELVKKGLISTDYKRRSGKIATMLFKINPLPQQKWVWVEAKLFELHLSSSELKVYLYIKCRANHTGRAWPSVSTISKDTGLAEETVRRAIKGLMKSSLICRKMNRRVCSCFGNNHYIAFTCSEREQTMIILRKKKARTRKIRRRLNSIKKNVHYSIDYHRTDINAIAFLQNMRC